MPPSTASRPRKEAGFLVCTNTTVFKETDMAELDEMFAYLTSLGVDGFMISPVTAIRRSRRRNLHDPRRYSREIPRGGRDVLEVQIQHVADLSGVLQAARNVLHGWGNPTKTSKVGKAPAT